MQKRYAEENVKNRTSLIEFIYITVAVIVLSGCSTQYYSITVVDQKNQPVAYANYETVYEFWGKPADTERGVTDEDGNATIKSRQGANIFVRKDNLWGMENLQNSPSYTIKLHPDSEYSMPETIKDRL